MIQHPSLRRPTLHLFILLCLLTSAFFARAAGAAIAFGNFGPGDAYGSQIGWGITNSTTTTGYFDYQGEAFTAALSGPVTAIRAAISKDGTGGNGSFVLSVYADNAGSPGGLLGTFSGRSTGIFGQNTPPAVALPAVGSKVNLVASQTYWVIATLPQDARAVWDLNSTGDQGLHYYVDSNGTVAITTDTHGAFEVQVGSNSVTPPTTAAAPVVTMSTTVAQTIAGGSPGVITVQRTGDLSKDLAAPYSISGNAVGGQQYQTLPGTVTLPAGQASTQIPINALADGIREGTTVVKLQLLAGSGYTVGSANKAEVKILDND